MALDIGSSDPKKELRRIWLQMGMAALAANRTGHDATRIADEMMLAYHARFLDATDDKLNASLDLDIALKFFERSALVGQRVIRRNMTDVPSVGIIKDFAEPHQGYSNGMALIKWEEDHEEWQATTELQLIAFQLEPVV